MWAEVRKRTGWEQIGHVFDEPKWMKTEEKTDQPYSGRNYNLFAMLADVRNRFDINGRAPRGVPTDATAEYLEEVEEWGGDGHSHSWLTLAELEAYDWDQTVRMGGFVTAKEYEVFKKEGRPQGYCQGVGGGNVRRIDNSNMDDLIKRGKATESDYTHVEWDKSYRDAAGEAWWKTMADLRALGSPDDVRIVFFFDN